MKIRRDPTDVAVEELKKCRATDLLESKRIHIENKNKFRNLSRCQNTSRLEEEEDRRITTANEPFLRKAEEVEREETLARELAALKREEIADKRYRQQLRESSHELRALEMQLKAAYVSKELKAQIAEKEAMKLQDKLQDQQASATLAKVWYKDEEYRKAALQEDMIQKAKYREELQNQIILQEKGRRCDYEELLRDKMLLDDTISRLHDEDVRAIEERMLRMKRTQQEIDAFKAAQSLLKEKQKKQLEEENRQLQEYLLSKATASLKSKEKKAQLAACKERISDDIAKKMYEEKRQRQEREEIIANLQEEEVKDEIERRHKNEIAKQERLQNDMLSGLAVQTEQRREEMRNQYLYDKQYREDLMTKLAEQERVEQLSNDKKRRKMIEIRKEVERTIIEHRQKKVEDMQLQKKLLEMKKQEDDKRQIFIREERVKLLNQHAMNLIGFLPPGAIQPDDVPYLKKEVVGTRTVCDDNK